MKRLFTVADNPYYYDMGILFVRICVSCFMLSYGWPKLIKLFGGEPTDFPNPIGLGSALSLALTVFSEVICSILLIIGLATRLATIPLIITMLVAGLVVQYGDPFHEVEATLLYFLVYLMLFFTGSGRYSVDRFLYRQTTGGESER